jgi:hypothetical protein
MEWNNILKVLAPELQSKILNTNLLIYECEGEEPEIKVLV